MNAIATTWRRAAAYFSESVVDNALVVKGLRTQMRGWKTFLFMAGYVLVVGAAAVIGYCSMVEYQRHVSGPTTILADRNVGMDLFTVLAWTQTILLTLAAASLTSGALSQEIEKKTIELMALTRLTTGNIVLGKHLAAFLFLAVLVFSSLPLSGICLLLGGISPAEIAITYAALLGWCFVISAVGVFWSSLFNRTPTAGLLSHLFCIGYLIQTSAVGGMNLAMHYSGSTQEAFSLGALAPGWVPMQALSYAKVCGIGIPVALIAVALNVALGAWMLVFASAHVRHYRVERALPIRVLGVLITLALTWLLVGDHAISGSSAGSAGMLVGFWASALQILCYAIPFLATGRVRAEDGKPMPDGFFAFGKVFKGSLSGVMPFMLCWIAALWGCFTITVYWLAKVEHAAIPSYFWSRNWHLAVFVLAFALALCAIGMLFSAITRTRRAAVILVIVFLLVVNAIPYVLMYDYSLGPSRKSTALGQFAAFWPWTPMQTAAGEWGTEMPQLWWEPLDSWAVSTVVYVWLGLLALAFVRSSAKKNDAMEE